MKAKVTDKNIQALEHKGAVDDELGMATPCSLMSATRSEEDAKAEVPSLGKLKEQQKACKTTYMEGSDM